MLDIYICLYIYTHKNVGISLGHYGENSLPKVPKTSKHFENLLSSQIFPANCRQASLIHNISKENEQTSLILCMQIDIKERKNTKLPFFIDLFRLTKICAKSL